MVLNGHRLAGGQCQDSSNKSNQLFVVLVLSTWYASALRVTQRFGCYQAVYFVSVCLLSCSRFLDPRKLAAKLHFFHLLTITLEADGPLVDPLPTNRPNIVPESSLWRLYLVYKLTDHFRDILRSETWTSC